MTVNQIIEKFKSGRWLDRASVYLENPKKIKILLNVASRYLSKKGLRDVIESIQTMCRYVNEVIRGKYPDYNGASITIIVGALIYTVSPFDAIPDIIPGVGFLDDTAVIGWATTEVTSELKRFGEWEKNKSNKKSPYKMNCRY